MERLSETLALLATAVRENAPALLPSLAPSSTRTLSVSEVCERLSCGPTFVRALIAAKKLKAVRLGRSVRVRESDLAEYLTRVAR